MSLKSVLGKLAIQLLSIAGERVITALVNAVSGSSASPADIARATKSHIAADREAKIASEQARWKSARAAKVGKCVVCGCSMPRGPHEDPDDGLCHACERAKARGARPLQAWQDED